jgi:hypothetical protein
MKFPIYGKIKNDPNNQPALKSSAIVKIIPLFCHG